MSLRTTNRDTGDDASMGSDPGPAPSTPGWVKIFGVAFIVLVLVIAIMIASGHGPGRHMASGGPGAQTPSLSVVDNGVRQS
jgi:hypothetical protein